jgi:hypothetical protein
MTAPRSDDAPFPLLRSVGLSLVGVLVLAGCGEDTLPRAGGDGEEFPERVIDAEVDLRIGLADGDPRYLFGNIQGIALDGQGRIFVADGRSRAIRVYNENGEHLFEFGQGGDGPGEFYNPCCIAFDDRDRLWVWSAGDLARQLRYDVFDVSGTTYRHEVRIQGAPIGQLWPRRRILFDSEGRVLHTTFFTESVQVQGGVERQSRHARLHLDAAGDELRRVPVPFVSRDSLGGIPPTPSPGNVTRARVGALVAMQLRAHSPRGGFVDAVNTRYEVNWYDDDGHLVRVTRRELTGPALTGEERDETAAALQRRQEILRQQGTPALDLSLPERHQPLERLFFDTDGRLWVQRRITASDTLEVADLYLRDGSYLHTVRWPRDILLYHGAVDGDAVYGVSLDEFDIPRLVRLRVVPPER